MKIEEIPPAAWQAGLEPAWDALLAEAPGATPFLSPGWLAAWWRHLGAGRRPLLLALTGPGGRLEALAPLSLRPVGRGALGAAPALAFLGDARAGSEYLGVLARAGAEDAAAAAIAAHLRGRWALADLRGLRPEDRASAALLDALSAGAPRRVDRVAHPCSYVPLPADYDAYLAGLGRKLRANVRYETRALARDHEVRLVRTAGEGELGPHLDRLFALHQARWRSSGLPGVLGDPAMQGFYRDFCADFLRRGWLRFHHLRVDGEIRASQLGFAFRGVLHALQEGFDPAWRGGSVGTVLRGLALQDAIEEGLVGYDFLGGDEPYKQRWNTVPRQVQRVTVGAAGPAGALAFAATAGVRRGRALVRGRAPRWLLEARRRALAWRRAGRRG